MEARVNAGGQLGRVPQPQPATVAETQWWGSWGSSIETVPVQVKPSQMEATIDIVEDRKQAEEQAAVVHLWRQLSTLSGAESLQNMLWQGYLNNLVRSALGLVAAEVWTDVDQSAGVLLSRKAYYIDPVFDSVPLDVATRAMGSNVPHCAPGVGLAGVLWQSASRNGEALSWTPLANIVKDEDIPDDKRTTALAATFDLVAAMYLDPSASREVAGHVDGGLLILYARSSAQQQLAHPSNVAFLAANAILGSTMLGSTQAAEKLAVVKKNRNSAWAKVRTLLRSGLFLHAVRAEAARLESGESKIAPEPSKKYSVFDAWCTWLVGYLRKWRGAPGSKAPMIKPIRSLASVRTFAWTGVGVFLTLLTLSALNQYAVHVSEGQYYLMLGSFGALMALQYGAPNSPLAQPRNVIGGTTLASSISILVYYLSGPEHLGVLPKWVSVALAPALAIAMCQRVNLLHPPAGAAALIFVGGDGLNGLGWMYLLFPLLLGNLVCIFMSMVINNAAKDRQYPVFW
jgi:hypothetical protein